MPARPDVAIDASAPVRVSSVTGRLRRGAEPREANGIRRQADQAMNAGLDTDVVDLPPTMSPTVNDVFQEGAKVTESSKRVAAPGPAVLCAAAMVNERRPAS